MGDGIFQGIKTTWDNADTRLNPLAYYKPDIQQEIEIREMGGLRAFKHFTSYVGNVTELKQEKCSRWSNSRYKIDNAR